MYHSETWTIAPMKRQTGILGHTGTGIFGRALTTAAALLAGLNTPVIPTAVNGPSGSAQQIEQGQQKQQQTPTPGQVHTIHATRTNPLGNRPHIAYKVPSSTRFTLTAKQKKGKTNRIRVSKLTKRKHRRA